MSDSQEMKKTILVADDAPDILVVLEKMFTSAGYNAIAAANGKEAYHKATELRPDLIVSDILMPLMNGFKLCEELKNNPKYSHIPIILLTAVYRNPDHIEMGFKFGADAYISKPFKPEQLLDIVKQLLKKAAAAPPPPLHPNINISSSNIRSM